MKIEIVRFTDGSYGVRKSKWFDPYGYLILGKDYTSSYGDMYWTSNSTVFHEQTRTMDYTVARCSYDRWMEVQARQKEQLKADRASSRDKGKRIKL